jgi:predicted dienelactone hydrolase
LVPPRRPPQPDVFKPETWNDSTFADRRNDLKALIDGMLSHRELQRVIDAQSIGAAGHSLGGYTVVGMAGGWASWADARIRAVLALSPYVMPFQVRQTLGNVRVPLMYQGGTLGSDCRADDRPGSHDPARGKRESLSSRTTIDEHGRYCREEKVRCQDYRKSKRGR